MTQSTCISLGLGARLNDKKAGGNLGKKGMLDETVVSSVVPGNCLASLGS